MNKKSKEIFIIRPLSARYVKSGMSLVHIRCIGVFDFHTLHRKFSYVYIHRKIHMEEQSEQNESEPFLSHSLQEKGVPHLTKWRGISKNLWFAEKYPVPYFTNYKLSFFPNFPLYILLSFSYHLWYHHVFIYFSPKYHSFKYIVLITFILGIYSLFKTIITDPGYLPFYYPVTNKASFTSDELRSGIAIDEAQIDFARSLPKPPRMCFSQRVGFFVIRADHYCSFIGQWIGLYDHRYFFNTTFYLGIYLLLMFLSVCAVSLLKIHIFSFFEELFFLSLSGFFGFLFLNQFLYQSANITRNQTSLENLKKKVPGFYNRGCISNWEEIFGPRKYILLWMVPFVPLKPTIDGLHYEKDTLNEDDDSD